MRSNSREPRFNLRAAAAQLFSGGIGRTAAARRAQAAAARAPAAAARAPARAPAVPAAPGGRGGGAFANVARAMQGAFGGPAAMPTAVRPVDAAGGGGGAPFAGGGAPAQRMEGGAPAASARALARLPVVVITEEDLKKPGNGSCCICLDMHEAGSSATRLPCGHLFCRECIADWLRRHCICPMCRFEMPTDDAAFELRRTQRMAQRRPRYTLGDLRKMRVAELNRLCDGVGVNRVECLTKQDLVTCIATSGRIEVLSSGSQGSSGSSSSGGGSGGGGGSSAGSSSGGGGSSSGGGGGSASSRTGGADETEAALMGERVAVLRKRALAAQISLSGCVEKRDIVDRLLGRTVR